MNKYLAYGAITILSIFSLCAVMVFAVPSPTYIYGKMYKSGVLVTASANGQSSYFITNSEGDYAVSVLNLGVSRGGIVKLSACGTTWDIAMSENAMMFNQDLSGQVCGTGVIPTPPTTNYGLIAVIAGGIGAAITGAYLFIKRKKAKKAVKTEIKTKVKKTK